MYQLTEELKAKVKAIFDQEIDPEYVRLARIIEPKLGDNPRYLPAILAYAITKRQLEIIFALPDTDRDPELKDWEVSDSFAEKLHMPKEQVEEEMRELYVKGHVYTKQNTLNLATPSSFWIDVQHRNALSKHPYGDEYYYALSLYADIEKGPIVEENIRRRLAQNRLPIAHVVPRYDSVKDNPDLMPVENVKEILESRERIVILPCSCRQRFPGIESVVKGGGETVCLLFNESAEKILKRGIGQEVTAEEAFGMIDEAGKKWPFIHVSNYADNLDDVGNVMCQCNKETCIVLRRPMVTGSGYPVWEHYGKSRYRAEINSDLCIDCGICAKKRCMFDAIKVQYNIDYGTERHTVNADLCMGCGCCVESCPKDAITMYAADPPEILTKGRQDALQNIAVKEVDPEDHAVVYNEY